MTTHEYAVRVEGGSSCLVTGAGGGLQLLGEKTLCFSRSGSLGRQLGVYKGLQAQCKLTSNQRRSLLSAVY